ncbi:MAG: hypothetical protein WC530_11370, partial [Candidatus Omnitrophota bacterium]
IPSDGIQSEGSSALSDQAVELLKIDSLAGICAQLCVATLRFCNSIVRISKQWRQGVENA